jgi:hypothetical protein
MYLIATHIPIHTDGTRHYTDISWQRDLILARDWLARPYGGLGVIAPALPLQAGDEQGMVLVPIGLGDGIRVFPSFPARNSARQFWLRDRHEWNADVHRAQALASTNRLSVLVDIGDAEGAAAQLASLHGQLEQLRTLSRNERAGGLRHSVDQSYRVRAEWTREICAPSA